MKNRSKRMMRSLIVAIVSLLLCFVLCFGLTACGEAGPAGPAGPQGEPGIQGPPGDKGDPGDGSGSKIDDVYTPSKDIEEGTVSAKATKSGNLNAKGKFYTDYATLEEEQLANKELAIKIASEGFTLLKNANNALPLKSEKKLTVFGARSANYVHSGGGSGAGTTGANGIKQSTVKGALENAGYSVNPKTIDVYNMLNSSEEIGMDYYTEAVTSTYKMYNDAALIMFSRSGSEGGDVATNSVSGHKDEDDHYLQLTDNEEALIKHVKKYFPEQKIIVAINSSNIMQIPELAEEKTDANLGVDAILWIGGPGNNGMEALGRILNGTVNPSGHTSDLWARDFKKSPTWTNSHLQDQHKDKAGDRMNAKFYHKEDNELEETEFFTIQYREDMYMGYRYYETMSVDMNATEDGSGEKWYDENVLYPFGYGLSYTDFEWKLDNVAKTATIDAANRTVTVRVWVKNIGDVPGKDVVQVYFGAPYKKGGIEKAATNLIGFAKTDLLQPGEAQIVTVKFAAQEMASFDWNDANKNEFKGYELEAGDYTITINRNSHDVVDSVVRTVTDDIKCETDYITGNKIKPVFVGNYSSVNDNLLANKISRADGLKQPAVATPEDRELTDAEYQRLQDQYSYRSYQDKPTDPWYVKAVPTNWNQATEHESDYSDVKLKLADMAGIPYNESVLKSGDVVVETDENTKKWDDFMNQLTWTEMCDILATGTGAIAVPSIGKLADKSADGPVQQKGVAPYGTLFPSAPILAATFNVELAAAFGRGIANDCIFTGVTDWLGPGLNTHRSPFGGRNFEYYSEDGMHAAIIAENVIREVTAKGILTYLKHFFLNDQESHRMDEGGVATFATEQVMREIYLKPFEYVVKNGNCFAMMSSFNRVGYEVMATNWAGHRDLLRDEWGFRGSMVTDAWAKQYTSLDLTARAGDEQVLGQSTSFPENSLHYGEWSATDKCVKVAANKEDEESKTYTVLSPTHYYAVRRSAQAVLYTRANSIANNNAYNGDEIILTDAEFSVGVAGSYKIKMPGYYDATFTMTAGEIAKLPKGLTFDEAKGTISGTVADGEVGSYPVSVGVKCDGGRISTNLTVKIQTADKWRSNGKGLLDNTIKIKAGEAYESVFDCPTHGYGTNVPDVRNRHIFNWGVDADGTKWSLKADQFFADLIAKDVSDFVTYNEYHFEIWLDDTELTDGGAGVNGLSFTQVKGTHMGRNGSYEINTGAKLSGTPASAGTYQLKIVIKAPWCGSKFGSSSLYPPQYGADWVTFEKTLTLVVEN